MLDSLVDLVEGSSLGYLIIAALAWADALFPTVPGEAALFTGAILAASGAMALPLVGLAGFVGGVTGDCTAYALGRRYGARVRLRAGRLAPQFAWAERHLQERGEAIVIVARFIPGGRTVVAYAAGSVGFPARRFVGADAIAAAAWATYACAAGYLGGLAFRDSLWQPLVLATVLAMLIGLAAERWRRTRYST